MDQSIFDIQANFCKAMGHPVRLQVLHILREGPMSVSDLVRRMGFSQSMISRQLHVLRFAEIVTCERHGVEMIYQLTDEKIGNVCDMVRQVLSENSQKRSESLLK